jgi:hypothetical protein
MLLPSAVAAHNRQEMYSEERREVMQQQVSSLHHHQQQQQQQVSCSVSQEAQEWQLLARKEKQHVEYAESSHFSMVRLLRNYLPKSTVTHVKKSVLHAVT